MKTKTYAGIPADYAKLETANIVLVPVPYDGTSTWQKGADQGPRAFLEASENMELYDIETDSEVYKQGIFLAEPVEENSSPEAMVQAVHRTIKDYIKRNKFVTLFGGEHSVSIGAIRAFNECFSDLTVLHIDAHADLRNSYEGSACNHACAVYEASQNTNLIQVGIRSMDASELSVMDQENVYFAHEIMEEDSWMDSAIDSMSNNVYITLDLDAFDPSILPATGTPEPGGMGWYQMLDFLNRVFAEKNVVGFDIVELCPNEIDKSSDFLAAKLYYKMLSYKFMDLDEDEDYFDDEMSLNSIGNNSKYHTDDDY